MIDSITFERTHTLKSWPKQFEAVKSGQKWHELRINDRDYRPGDFLLLREYDLHTGYSGDEVRVGPVTYITRCRDWMDGVFDDWVVLGFRGRTDVFEYDDDDEDDDDVDEFAGVIIGYLVVASVALLSGVIAGWFVWG